MPDADSPLTTQIAALLVLVVLGAALLSAMLPRPEVTQDSSERESELAIEEG